MDAAWEEKRIQDLQTYLDFVFALPGAAGNTAGPRFCPAATSSSLLLSSLELSDTKVYEP